MKYLITLAFVGILASLGSALYFMMKDGREGKTKTNHMVRALALRVGLSVLLFLSVLLAWALGYLHPTGIPPGA